MKKCLVHLVILIFIGISTNAWSQTNANLPILQTQSAGVGNSYSTERLSSSGKKTVCEGIFMDAGGSSDYTTNASSFTYTFCPEGDNVMILNFTEFNLCGNSTAANQDVMEIYAGGAVDARFLIGRYTRATSPGTVSNVGCLTVKFNKNNSSNTCVTGSNRSGWRATVNCMPLEYYGNAGNPGYANGSTCFMANPFCSGSNYNFSNLTGSSAPSGPNYGCLYRQPNPVWYFMSISQGGSLRLALSQHRTASSTSNGIDIDFAMWGPFNSVAEACSQILSGTVPPIQCSYDPQSNEIIGIGLSGGTNYVSSNFGSNNRPPNGNTTPPAAREGDIYLLLLTNFSNQSGFIRFSQTAGTGVSDCSIVALPLGPDLISFKGDVKEGLNYLDWYSENERQLSKYILERSEDGFHWDPIYTVNTQNTVNEANHYVIEDSKYKHKMNYYRLVSIDVQGRYSYSDIVALDNTKTDKNIVAVYNEIGQLIDEKTKGFKILVYDDGSTVKKFD